MNSSNTNTPQHGQADYFVTTRWTVVLTARQKTSPQSDQALADLCQSYWFPLYTFVRRQGYSREDAEDLTQAFFARFLQRNYLEGLKSERGRFRAFLLASLKHFLANEWDKKRRQKRGGDLYHLSLDWQSADEKYHLEVADNSNPEWAFDRSWALTLLERVITRLRKEYFEAGKAEIFEHGKTFLTGAGDATPHAEAARHLNMDEGALRVAIHRMRKRYRETLRDEIAQTISDPTAVNEELLALQQALRGSC